MTTNTIDATPTTTTTTTTTEPAELEPMCPDPASMSCLTCREPATHAVQVGAFGSVCARGYCDRCYRPSVYLMRGRHMLPHQSQQLGRDLAAEEIRRNPGAEVFCYRMSDEQVTEHRAKYGHDGYLFLVHSPKSSALSWTAFRSWEDMVAWADAYAITLPDDEPEQGRQFKVTLPTGSGGMAPVRPAVTLYDWVRLHDDRKLGNSFAPRVLFLDPDTGVTVLAGAHVLRYRPNV